MITMRHCVAYLAISILLPFSDGFQAARYRQSARTSTHLSAERNDSEDTSTRKLFVSSIAVTASAGMSIFVSPQLASAGIDVSGLQMEGGSGNPNLASQLKAYDGSGSARVREAKAMQTEMTTPNSKTLDTTIENSAESKVAHWAYRANPGLSPSLSRAGTFGNLYRCNDQLVAPSGSKRRSLGVQFEFPADWLQLDKYNGGFQYVDQRNGDKLYVLMAALPQDTSLENLPKSVIGDLIFDPQGSVVKTGQTVEDYKVSSAQILSQCPDNLCATRRRFKLKYATVTGNGLRVERRALVDAYQVENDIYMLMTSSNAIKFEQKESQERETVENIVASFQLDV
jgi:hypothetical protein